MPIYTLGPLISQPNTQYKYTVPPDLNNIIGFQIENYSIFDMTIQGIAATLAHLWPNMGCYYPVSFPTTGQFPLLFMTGNQQTLAPVELVNSIVADIFNHVGVNVFLEGDGEPTPYIPYALGLSPPFVRGLGFKVKTNAVLANSSSAHTTTLGPFTFSNLAGGGLYLTRLQAIFGNPSSAAAGDCTLTDILGATLESYHLNLTTAGPQVILECDFTEPLQGGISGGQSSFSFNNPAITNGPGYSINLSGFLI